jgi:hypothetical protein
MEETGFGAPLTGYCRRCERLRSVVGITEQRIMDGVPPTARWVRARLVCGHRCSMIVTLGWVARLRERQRLEREARAAKREEEMQCRSA